MKNLLLTLFCLSLLHNSAMADNWAHWRGPTGNSVSLTATPPTKWSETKNIKWKAPIPGRGSGSPVIWEQQVFVSTAVPAAGSSAGQSGRLDFKILCFDRGTGKLLWDKTATQAVPHQATHPTNGFASASPCTDGKQVYAFFGSRGLYCYTMNGDLVWKRDDFGKMNTRADFGEGSSPTIEGEKILVPWDHEGPSSLYALNKLTGKTIWKTERDEPSCWATPLVVEHNGSKQVIMNGQTCARSYDLETGKELWRCAGQTQRPVASAVSTNGLAIIGSGYQGSFIGGFKMDGRGNIENTKNVVWEINQGTPDIASPLLSNGRLYFHQGKSGALTCVNAMTGTELFNARFREIKRTYASPVAANGHIYLTGRSGNIVVIKDAPQLEIISVNVLGEGVDATPAPAGNQLIIRGENNLFCISVK